MSTSAKSIKRLITLALDRPLSGYNESEIGRKYEFHRLSRKVLREIASRLSLTPKQYDIRTNPSGPVVSGETIFHSDNLYIDFSQTILGPDIGFMYRKCKGRKDFEGGKNCWMPWKALYDLEKTCEIFENF